MKGVVLIKQEWLRQPFLIFVWDRFLPILYSSIEADVYTILCFSEMSPRRADLFPGLIVLTSPQELSADLIPRIVEVILQATKPRTFVDSKEYFLCHIWLLPSLICLLFQINLLVSFLWLKFVCYLKNVSRVSCNSFLVDPENKLLKKSIHLNMMIILCILKTYSLMWGIKHNIQPVTS